ncbi:MAG: adenosylcobinamide-phosphate synthase CbiB [Rhodobacteraceae bacterium]|jgi:adenosylcobinamide-phosphate synthase|nr:adenosylcobinamide-phosphate synthase CbiB [Paracoccaceae bacterium]
MGWELVIAMLLDAVFGEPRMLWDRLPHPAVLMGRLVAFLDRTLNTGQDRKSKGVLALSLLCFTAAVIGSLLSQFGWVIEIIVAAILLAQKSLVDHVRAVATGLRTSIEEGQFAVSMIVSRDTKDMNEAQVARSAIESAAENFSDGVIAPAFWFLVGGLPAMLVYKFVNTADSMIGYKTEKYLEFGWASARIDDLLNWIPARLSMLLIVVFAKRSVNFRAIISEAKRHKSPNAGWPEAAMARAINVALAGPRSYDGQLQQLPWVNERGRQTITADDVDAAVRILWRAWNLAWIAIIVVSLI